MAVEAVYLSSRETLAGATVSPATTVNVNMIQPIGRGWELLAGVRNIFDNRYADPVSIVHRQDSIAQNGRTARIGLRWQSGKKP